MIPMNFNAFKTEIGNVRTLVYDYQEAHVDKPILARYVQEILGQPFSENVQRLEESFFEFSDDLPIELDSLLTEFKNAVVNPTPDPANPFAFLGFQGDFDNPQFRRFYTTPFREFEVKTLTGTLYDSILTNVLSYNAEIAAAVNVSEAEQKLELMAKAMDLVVTWLSFFLDYTIPEMGTITQYQQVFATIADSKSPYENLPQFQSYNDNVRYLIRRYRHNAELVGLLEDLLPETRYTVYPAKYETEYQTGDVIAELLGTAVIQQATVTKGALPCGMELDSSTGSITVSDPTVLSPGMFFGTVIQLVDDMGHEIEIDELLLEVKPNCQPVLVQLPSFSMSEYQIATILAEFIVLEDGVEINSAKVSEGKLPPGVGLHSLSSQVFVYNPSIMKAGEYSFKMEITDTVGGNTEHSVTLNIGEGEVIPPELTLEVTSVNSNTTTGDVVAQLPSGTTGVVKVQAMSPFKDDFFATFLTLDPVDGNIKLNVYDQEFVGDYIMALVAHMEDGSLQVFTAPFDVS